MKIIFSLGNHDIRYENTRHNTGFFIVDAFAAAHGLEWTAKSAFKAIIASGLIDGQKIILVKPTTFYNLAGESARAIKDFYKIDNADIIAVHDELALPFGTIRTRLGGSDAGNNGIKSLSAHLGGDFARIRVGIANSQLEFMDAADFVLARFTKEEREQLPHIAKSASELIDAFIGGELAHTTVTHE